MRFKPLSPALRAKERVAISAAKKLQAVQATHAENAAARKARKAKTAAPTLKRTICKVVTGGKAYKNGMVLARAKLTSATSDLLATQDRQNTLLAKGRYREAEVVAREAPVGTMHMAGKPKRMAYKDCNKHRKDFGEWMKKTLKGKVWQLHSPRTCH